MIFQIQRASNLTKKPCKDAFGGTLHEGGHDTKVWHVEFQTLEELAAFVEREGSIIVHQDRTITIYDDMVE